jgi:hypothetical protein
MRIFCQMEDNKSGFRYISLKCLYNFQLEISNRRKEIQVESLMKVIGAAVHMEAERETRG